MNDNSEKTIPQMARTWGVTDRRVRYAIAKLGLSPDRQLGGYGVWTLAQQGQIRGEIARIETVRGMPTAAPA